MTITLVAAMGRNRVIGADGGMPWHLPEDLKHFKKTTLGTTMIMGRRTFDSIGRPLPGRRTIVVTRDAAWQRDGVDTALSLGSALAFAGDGPISIVGGGQIYAQAMQLADRMELTLIDAEPDGDTLFPEWNSADWREVSREPHDGFEFVTFERVRR
ncbi:dihydrofolate reductase [Paramicrobacterium agarici]|uniref:Dihydrofolate reductase n=1 Tax=Paramicrobacterium agarici TaxID=630514 RepID=A0A2A9DWJ1_9MICO|nr:dihydrofolate reductase [Microbacterium agarici]PFG30279.1 dihydrofolate reductase [Microbacterium agarici]TQO23286.1 dihydrofolate reductase [Microbacterium agarici]